MKRLLLAGACVAALLALGGCRAEGNPAVPAVVTTPANPTINNPSQDSTFSASSGTSASSTLWTFQANKFCRDQEITTKFASGRCCLRLTPTGNAIVFAIGASRDLTVRLVQGMNQQSSQTGTLEKTLFSVTLPVATTYTFGAVGVEVYIKADSTELYRLPIFQHTDEGRVGVKVNSGENYSAIAGVYYQDKAINSNLGLHEYDMRDFGWRRIKTTGSMSAASPTLTLPADAGFAVGDFVIVETGGEAGAGARGTKGVGGVWPAQSYANVTAMNADTSKANLTYAWLVDTGYVYQYSTGSSTWTIIPNDVGGNPNYYVQKAVPKSLKAQITAIANGGVTLTLDTSSTVATTSANVYLDCAWIVNKLTLFYQDGNDLSAFLPQMNIVLPEGDFPVSGSLWVNDYNRATNVGRNSLRGQGKEKTILRSPRGVTPVTIDSRFASDVFVRDVQLIGNLGDTGFGLNWAMTPYPMGFNSSAMQTYTAFYSIATGVTETDVPQAYAYGGWGVSMFNTDRATISNVKCVNMHGHTVFTSVCTYIWARNCDCVMTSVPKLYYSWQYLQADSGYGGFVDCTLEAVNLVAGWEAFKTIDTAFTRCTSINGVMGSNGSEGWSFTDCVIHTTPLCATTTTTSDNPLIDIDNNIGGDPSSVDGGGTITNITIVQNGYANVTNDNMHCIVIQADCPNVAITGGTITVPDYVPGAGQSGAMGVLSTGANTDVTGLTVIGKAKHEVAGSGYRNITLTGGSGSSASGCTANEVYVNP